MTALLVLGLTAACHAPDPLDPEERIPGNPPRTLLRPDPIGCPPRLPEGPDDWSADADGDCANVYADCDDNDPDRNPNAHEWCDGVDNDCDGIVDYDNSWQRDADGDGFGAGEVLRAECPGYGEGYIGVSDDPDDCDDSDPAVWPGATDVPGDGIDQDCTGADACGAICTTYDCSHTNGRSISEWADEYCDDFQEYPSLGLNPDEYDTSLLLAECVCAVGELTLYVGSDPLSLAGLSPMGVYGALRSDTFRGFDAGPDLPFAIESSTATSLEGLESVRTIPALMLGFYGDSYFFEYDENADLTSLAGLTSLEEVTGELYLYGLVSMTHLHGLERLRRVGELRIYDTGLVDMKGLEGLETAGSILIQAWPAMQSLDGLQGLVSVDSDFRLEGYYPMSLSGLDNLVSVGGDLLLVAPLDSLAGTESLRSVGGELVLFNTNVAKTGLTDLSPLAGLREVGVLGLYHEAIVTLERLSDLEHLGGLALDDVPLTSLTPLRGALTSTPSEIRLEALALSTLDGLENVTAVTGTLLLRDLPLTDLTGLASLEDAGSVTLDTLPITNLMGLESLEEVGSLVIRNNPSLVSLQGLEHLRSVTSTVDIVDNPLLPEEEVMALLNRIGRENIGGRVTIGVSE